MNLFILIMLSILGGVIALVAVVACKHMPGILQELMASEEKQRGNKFGAALFFVFGLCFLCAGIVGYISQETVAGGHFGRRGFSAPSELVTGAKAQTQGIVYAIIGVVLAVPSVVALVHLKNVTLSDRHMVVLIFSCFGALIFCGANILSVVW